MSDYSHLVGHRFPGATYTLPGYVCWLWADAAKLPPDATVAHPILAWFVAMQGVGASIQEIFDLAGTSPEAGVMFGECNLEWVKPMKADATYECSAEVTGVERKHGKRAGTFDKFAFRVTVREAGSQETVATCTNAWIIPRKDEEMAA
jgi:acyl dehydratase